MVFDSTAIAAVEKVLEGKALGGELSAIKYFLDRHAPMGAHENKPEFDKPTLAAMIRGDWEGYE
jgi:hypothetical protein